MVPGASAAVDGVEGMECGKGGTVGFGRGHALERPGHVCELGNHLDTTHDVGFSETFHQHQHAVEGQLTFMTRLS